MLCLYPPPHNIYRVNKLHIQSHLPLMEWLVYKFFLTIYN